MVNTLNIVTTSNGNGGMVKRIHRAGQWRAITASLTSSGGYGGYLQRRHRKRDRLQRHQHTGSNVNLAATFNAGNGISVGHPAARSR